MNGMPDGIRHITARRFKIVPGILDRGFNILP
jgi:hypothetical protein